MQQAERELAAATARIGVATANLFPQVALVGSIGSGRPGLGNHSEYQSSTSGRSDPGAIWPLLDFGALDAQVDIAESAGPC